MDLRQLEHFLAVVDHDGLSRAAERLYLSQPTLSQSIRSLERELNVTLFHRTGRRLAPTSTGELLAPYARQVLDDVVELRDATARLRTLDEGVITVMCVPEMSAEAVAAWTGTFSKAHPKVRLDIAEVDSSAALVEAVTSGRAELGFMLRPAARPDLDFVPLGSQKLLLVRPPGHVVEAPVVDLTEITDLPLVVKQASVNQPDVVQEALASLGVDAPIGATVPSRSAQLNFVLKSDFQAFLPMRMALVALDAGATVVETDPIIESEFGVVHRTGELAPAPQQLVQDVGGSLTRWFTAVQDHRDRGLGLVEAVVAARSSAI